MIEKKPLASSTIQSSKTAVTPPRTNFNFFNKSNYVWMIAGLVVIVLGMLVMSGGRSTNPEVFDQKEVYSATRITIAPILILIGLAIEVFAIFKKPKA